MIIPYFLYKALQEGKLSEPQVDREPSEDHPTRLTEKQQRILARTLQREKQGRQLQQEQINHPRIER